MARKIQWQPLKWARHISMTEDKRLSIECLHCLMKERHKVRN